MKSKLLIMGVLCAIAFTANAQTEKGKKLFGGSFNLLTANADQGSNTLKQNEFSIGPKFGYFFGKNLAIGIDVNYSYVKVDTTYPTLIAVNGSYTYSTAIATTKNRSSNIGPFIRYYVDITEKYKFFGQFNANIGFGKSEQSNVAPSEAKITAYGASVSPSFAFFPTKKIAVELGFGLLSYTNSTSKYEVASVEKSKTEGFRFGFDAVNPTVGVNFHF
jgi:hypothetical protein